MIYENSCICIQVLDVKCNLIQSDMEENKDNKQSILEEILELLWETIAIIMGIAPFLLGVYALIKCIFEAIFR